MEIYLEIVCMKKNDFNFSKLDVIVLDFDGVLTDNSVYIGVNGEEFVRCSRADGLAFDCLKRLKKPVFIISSEKNKVVMARAKKLDVSCYYGVVDKQKILDKIVKRRNLKYKNVLYVGNDLNDYHVMKKCGYKLCPADSHKDIKKISDKVLKTKGGKGVLREVLENIFKINILIN
tara:strand:+ start:2862 stop:3386 length:525 start_codon:yes stop_codon:yes gene_type:complete